MFPVSANLEPSHSQFTLSALLSTHTHIHTHSATEEKQVHMLIGSFLGRVTVLFSHMLPGGCPISGEKGHSVRSQRATPYQNLKTKKSRRFICASKWLISPQKGPNSRFVQPEGCSFHHVLGQCSSLNTFWWLPCKTRHSQVRAVNRRTDPRSTRVLLKQGIGPANAAGALHDSQAGRSQVSWKTRHGDPPIRPLQPRTGPWKTMPGCRWPGRRKKTR